ncbi:MAG: hypothetical protein U0174_12645 [Polyangiaceae bacterium]
MSTFNCLGFHLDNEKAFRILIERALRFGRVVDVQVEESEASGDNEAADDDHEDADPSAEDENRPTHCVLWTLPGKGGIEVWVLRDDDEHVVGCNPHLRSTLDCPASITEGSEDVALVSCEGFRVHAEVPNTPFAVPGDTTVNLSLFVREISKVADAEGAEVTLTAAKGDDPLLVRFTGPLESAVQATNPDTETQYGVLTLALSEASKLTMAVDTRRLKSLPTEGWVTGTGYLSAAAPRG